MIAEKHILFFSFFDMAIYLHIGSDVADDVETQIDWQTAA